jgi:hypothetical protein
MNHSYFERADGGGGGGGGDGGGGGGGGYCNDLLNRSKVSRIFHLLALDWVVGVSSVPRPALHPPSEPCRKAAPYSSSLLCRKSDSP